MRNKTTSKRLLSTHQLRLCEKRTHVQRGYILLPVVLAITLVAVIAFMMNREGTMNANRAAGLSEATEAQYLAEAGFKHANWLSQQSNCVGDLTIPSTALGSHSYTATVTSPTVTTNYSFNADRDTWLKEANKNDNFGGDAELQVSNKSSDNMRVVYHFDLSSITPGTSVTSATLKLYVTANDDLGEVIIYPLNTDWTETGATWNNLSSNFELVSITSIPPQGGTGWVYLVFTAQAQAWVNDPGSNYGIILIATSNEQVSKYTSKEYGTSSKRPKLEVNTASGNLSPVDVTVTGTLANGVSRTLSRSGVKAYQLANSLTLQPDAANGKDVFLKEDAANNNYGVSSDLWVESSGSGAGDNGLLQFNLNGIPKDARITSATLELFQNWTGTPGGTVGVYRVSRDWVEGALDGASGTGATWSEAEPGTNWTMSGGDFDVTPVDTADINPGTTGYYTWNVKALTQGWVSGIYPNQGLILTAASAGTLVGFRSSDHSTELERPKLTITYACECGNPCLAPQGSGKVLMVVEDPAALLPFDIINKALFESWGYTVDPFDDSNGQSQYDNAVATHDVVFIARSAKSSDVGTKLTDAPIGIVSEKKAMVDELGIAIGTSNLIGSDVEVVDTTHYITQIFPAGTLPIYFAGMNVITVTGPAPGLQILAELSGAGALTALDEGAKLIGEEEESGNAAGRRVMLPFIPSDDFNPAYVNNNGRLIVQRALEWAKGLSGWTGPLAHWKLDDGSGSTAIDSVGGHDGILNNGPTWTTGQIDGALDFDGVNDYVDAGSDSNLDNIFAGGATVSAWIYPEGWGENKFGRILDKADSLGGNRNGWAYELYEDNESLLFQYGFSGHIGNWITPVNSISLNDWQHVAVVYDNSSDTNDPILYINGVAQTVTEIDTPSGSPSSDAALNLTMGNYSLARSRTFDGMLDDVRIYKGMLTATEIAEIFNAGNTGPVAHWKLDEDSGATANDTAGNHHGLVSGGTWASGHIDGGLTFNGSSDHVSVPDDDTLDLVDAFTLSAWINNQQLNGYDLVFNKGDAGSDQNFYFGTVGDEITFGFHNGGFQEFNTTTVNLQTGTWYHIAATFDNTSDEVRVYLDGAEVLSTTTTISPIINAGKLYIGKSQHGEYWNGTLDDLRIYDRILSPAEVTALSSDGDPGPSACDGTYRDEFNERIFSGSDGTLDWSTTPWEEVGESDGATNGDVKVRTDLSDYQLRIKDNDNGGEGVERIADLSGATTATLTFIYRREDLDDDGDYVAVLASSTGTAGPWTELDRIGTSNDSSYQSYSKDISAYISATTAIRLRSSPSMGGSDIVWFDDIQIQCIP